MDAPAPETSACRTSQSIISSLLCNLDTSPDLGSSFKSFSKSTLTPRVDTSTTAPSNRVFTAASGVITTDVLAWILGSDLRSMNSFCVSPRPRSIDLKT